MVMSSMQIAAMSPVAQQMGGMHTPANYMQQITPPGLQGMGYGGPMGSQFSPPAFSVGIGAPPAPMGGRPAMGYMDPGAMQAGGIGGMMNLGFGAMLPGTGGASVLGERMTGTAINAAATVGSGVAALNTGAGIAGMLGFGGMGMAALGGTGVGLLAAGGIYGANQMAAGFGQRQQVNQVLRNRFGGMMGVGGGRGGMGFNAEEMGGISQMVREMGTQDIFTNMEELTRVMDKTSQMGLFRGIQSAKDFKNRFRKTVDTLKEIATTMNTTLEEATNFMDQGRQMGFFSGQDINRNLMNARFGAGSTGLSMKQVQQMGQTGAQMGRMMGMRGRQGAQTMQNLGISVAQGMRMGYLSDEMMSEATGGLQGGEAAAAMAQSMMQTEDRWMRSGAGRVMVAGLWNPETGGIDQAALRQVQSGQLSIRELRNRARQNINKTGGRRSEFFAQRERLMGQIQEQGGGVLGFGIMAEHMARRRGLEMEDPIMQRMLSKRFRLSQSEVEARIRMFRKLPEIQERGRADMRRQMDENIRSKVMEKSGIAGLERRISQRWEERFENPFRRMADELTTQISRGVEGFVRDMEGRVGLQMDESTKRAYEEFQRTGRRVTSPGGVRIMTKQERSSAVASLLSRTGGGGGSLASRIGGLLGTRPTGDIREQAAALGLGEMQDGEFVLSGGRKAERGELESMVRAANQQIFEGPDVKVGSGAMARMGEAALIAVTEDLAGAGEGRAYGLRAQAAGPAARKKMQQERIALLRRTNKETDRYFAKVGDDWVQQVAALQQIEEAGQVNRTFMGAPAGGTGVATGDLASIVSASREREQEAIGGLANLRFRTKTRRSTFFGIEVARRNLAKEEGDSLNLSDEVVGSLFRNKEVNSLMRAYVRGSPKESRAALARLRAVGQNRVNVTKEQGLALEEIFQEEITNDETSRNRLKEKIRTAVDQQDLRSNLAIERREREVGQEMLRGLRKNEYRWQKGVQAKAMSEVKAIAEARASGDVEEARKLEQAFLSNPENLGNRELQETLAGVPGLEYLSHGVNAASRVAERIMEGGPGTRRGSTKETRLIQTALQGAGLEDLKLTQRQMKSLAEAATSGKGSGLFMERLRTFAGKKGAEYAEKFGKRKQMFEQIAAIMSDSKVTEKEAQEFAARFGQGAAASLRMAGAADKPPTSAQQEKMLNWMEKQYIVMKAGISLDDATLERLAKVGTAEATEDPGGGKEGKSE
jgi:hypothetical protein